jgi:hypothetical protein
LPVVATYLDHANGLITACKSLLLCTRTTLSGVSQLLCYSYSFAKPLSMPAHCAGIEVELRKPLARAVRQQQQLMPLLLLM